MLWFVASSYTVCSFLPSLRNERFSLLLSCACFTRVGKESRKPLNPWFKNISLEPLNIFLFMLSPNNFSGITSSSYRSRLQMHDVMADELQHWNLEWRTNTMLRLCDRINAAANSHHSDKTRWLGLGWDWDWEQESNFIGAIFT